MTKVAYVHKSGSISLIQGDNVAIEKKIKGKPDEVVKAIEVGNINDGDYKKLMEKPDDFNLNRFGVRDITKDELKRRQDIIDKGRQ